MAERFKVPPCEERKHKGRWYRAGDLMPVDYVEPKKAPEAKQKIKKANGGK